MASNDSHNERDLTTLAVESAQAKISDSRFRQDMFLVHPPELIEEYKSSPVGEWQDLEVSEINDEATKHELSEVAKLFADTLRTIISPRCLENGKDEKGNTVYMFACGTSYKYRKTVSPRARIETSIFFHFNGVTFDGVKMSVVSLGPMVYIEGQNFEVLWAGIQAEHRTRDLRKTTGASIRPTATSDQATSHLLEYSVSQLQDMLSQHSEASGDTLSQQQLAEYLAQSVASH